MYRWRASESWRSKRASWALSHRTESVSHENYCRLPPHVRELRGLEMEPGEQIHHFDYVVSSRGQMKFLHIFCFFFFYCGSLTSMDLLKTRWMWSEMDDRRALRGGFVEASIGELVERMSDLKRSE